MSERRWETKLNLQESKELYALTADPGIEMAEARLRRLECGDESHAKK
jgi:hypothetical protein